MDGHPDSTCLESLFGSRQYFTLEFYLLTLTRVSRLAPQASAGKSTPARRGQSKTVNTHVLESIDGNQLRAGEPAKLASTVGMEFRGSDRHS